MAKKKAIKKTTKKAPAKKAAPKRAKPVVAKVVTPTEEHYTKRAVASHWQPTILRAILAIALGIYLIATPTAPLALFATIIGVFLLSEGILLSISACSNPKEHSEWAMLLFRSLLGILAGVFVLVQPAWFSGLNAESTTYIISVLAIIIGLLEMTHSFQLSEHVKNKYLMTLSGLLALIFGLLVILVPITNGAIETMVILGIYSIVFAVGLLLFSFELKLLHNNM